MNLLSKEKGGIKVVWFGPTVFYAYVKAVVKVQSVVWLAVLLWVCVGLAEMEVEVKE